MRRMPVVLALLAVLALPGLARSEEAASDLHDAIALLDGQEIWDVVKEFASDDMKGRKSGWPSGDASELWVATKMSEMGLHPADPAGAYLDPFTFDSANTVAPIELKIGDEALTYGKDYFDLIYGGDGKVTAEIVFAGYGISRPDAEWDDYAGIDVKGKIVMAIRGAPASRGSEFREERFIGYKSSTAADKGAAGFILVEGEKASTGTIQARFHRAKLPAVWATEAVADKVLAAKEKRLKKEKSARDAGKPGQSFATGVTATVEVHSKLKPGAKANNVLGMIKGRDPDLVREVVLVGAHADHLGIDPKGEVFNGADDNATGTAVMLAIADKLTLKRWKPKRTIVFVAFAAEEQGLYGAEAMAKTLHFSFPCDGVVCLLNMDMVGQGEPKVRISGVGSYPRIHSFLEGAVPESMKEDVNFSLRTAPNGDHWPFHNRGIPAFFIATQGKHPNYHTPLDDVERIKPELLEVSAKAVGSLLVKLGEHPEPLLNTKTRQEWLLREGARFRMAGAAEAKTPDVDTLLAQGVSGLIVDVAESDDLIATGKALRAAAKEKTSRTVIAHSASGVQNAYNRAKIALMLRARAGKMLAADPASVTSLRKQGYKIVAPFDGAPEAAGKMEAILAAATKAKMLVDLTGLDAEGMAKARGLLGTWPAVVVRPLDKDGYEATAKLQEAAGKETLFLVIPGEGANGFGLDSGNPVCICGPDPDVLCDHLCQHCADMNDIWWTPRSKERMEIRATLGGRLVQWLRRTR